MVISDIIRRNEELERQYAKAIDTIARLENKIQKLEEENAKLRKQVNTLMRAIEIASQIKDYNAQIEHLKSVLKKEKYGER
jgi:flagellar biosynthesis chaperone FliJ